MPFTPVNSGNNTLIIRSREYGDGSEFNDDGSSTVSLDIIPDHFVVRLWRKDSIRTSTGGKKVNFINKSPNSSDRSVAYSVIEEGNVLHVKKGDSGSSFLKVQWEGNGLRAMERSNVNIENQTTTVKNFVRKSASLLTSSQSRTFTGPDGLEYKWKVTWCGVNPAYPDSRYLELFPMDSKVPIASTARLANRDGNSTDDTHPLYIAEGGLRITGWIVATHTLVDKLLAAS